MNEYVDEKGRVVKVSSGISGGEWFATYGVKPSGSLQRIKSKHLPERKARQEAQEDLDRYAEERDWPLAVEGVTDDA